MIYYVFFEAVRYVKVPSVQLFRVLLPYFVHLLPFRYHLPRAQLRGFPSWTVGSCHLFGYSYLVVPIILLSSICLHFSFQLCSLSCLALLWKTAFSILYSLSYPLLRTSLRSSAIFTVRQLATSWHFVTFFHFAFGTILSAVSFTMSRISLHSSSDSLDVLHVICRCLFGSFDSLLLDLDICYH